MTLGCDKLSSLIFLCEVLRQHVLTRWGRFPRSRWGSWLRTEFVLTILLQHAFSSLIIDKATIYPHATVESLCHPPFHSLINTNKTDACMNAHTCTYTHTHTLVLYVALTISYLHGNAIIWLWGVTLEWLTMCLTTSLSKHKEKLRRMEYILCLLFSSGFSIYTFKLPMEYAKACHPASSCMIDW